MSVISPPKLTFKNVGNDDDLSTWTLAPAPTSVSVREGAGIGGSDRVTITWADDAIAKQWLEVTVLPTTATRLANPDVHYWGNAVGESGNAVDESCNTSNTQVNATDELFARFNQHNFLDPAAIDDRVDYDRDTFVNATDQLISRFNGTNFLTDLELITVPAPGSAQEHSPIASVSRTTAFDTNAFSLLATIKPLLGSNSSPSSSLQSWRASANSPFITEADTRSPFTQDTRFTPLSLTAFEDLNELSDVLLVSHL